MSAAPSLAMLTSAEQAATVFEPTRLRLLTELREPASASQLARRFGEQRQRVNYHLRALESAGLVRLVEERRRGNCTERIVQATASAYLVSPEALGALGATPEQVKDRFSSAYLVAVSAEAVSEVATLRARAERAGKALPTLTVQTEVRFASQESMSAFAREATELLTRLAAKHHDGSAADGRLFKFFLGGYPAITKDEQPATEPEDTRP